MKSGLSAQKQSITAGITFLFIWFVSLSFLGIAVERTQTTTLLLTYGVSFLSYFWVLRLTRVSWNILLGTGLLMRLVFFLELPHLSDDFFRFIWDGTILANGRSPYGLLPQEALNLGIPGITPSFFDQLNSPEYYTIYPPLNQAIFWISATLGGPDEWLTSVNVIRSFLLFADLGSVFLLRSLLQKRGANSHLAYWYFLNPLVVLEFTGNLHFEGLVIFFLLFGIHQFQSSKIWGQGLGFAGAIATKLVPLIFLPAVLMKQWPKRGFIVCLLTLVVASITFLPLISSALVSGMGSSIGLYFQSFEFNASIYFIVREIGFAVKGYNLIQQIGPWLGISTFLLIMTWSFVASTFKKELPLILLGSLCIYLLLSTTVHPWYVLPLIPLGILSGYYFPVVWSLVIFLTYAGYSQEGFQLPMIWIIVEYLVVLAVFVLEIFIKREKG